MADFIELKCQRCGGQLERKIEYGAEIYVCQSCGKTYEKNIKDVTARLSELLNDQQLEFVANLKTQLWKEVHEEYISNREVERVCNEILRISPEDFYANFYLATCTKSKTALGDFLQNVDIDERYDDIPDMLEYLIKGLKPEWSMAVGNFIERAYKNSDIKLYNKFRTEFEKVNAEIEEGVFEPSLPRDVFIAYSSADMPEVERLTRALEDEGLMCFVAARNLRHGSGSVENYENAIHTAIDHCSVLVFVSSQKSRSLNCDAYKELNYIGNKRKDMPRVEYLVENYSGKAMERYFRQFFEGLEYCTSAQQTVERVLDKIIRIEYSPKPDPQPDHPKQPIPVDYPIPDKLIRDLNRSYGTKAQIIYDDCCDKFNWNKNMRGSFGPQRLLYAKEVTPEKYSVWFIANSNLSGTKGGTWRNYVQGETITEYWDSSARAGLQDKDIRLTFAKKLIDGKYGYAFIGIYDVKSIVFNQVSQKWVKTYKLIKEQYERIPQNLREKIAQEMLLTLGDFKDIGGGYITFGAYPQNKKADDVQIGELYDQVRNYYLGNDNNLYAKWQGEYYKVEPIKWKVLRRESEIFVVADDILDACRFDADSNNYANSVIRKWLNGEFYSRAFNESQRVKIVTTLVDNSLSSTGDVENKYTCDNTSDKVFLLSRKEAEQYLNSNDALNRLPTEYSVARGTFRYTGNSGPYKGKSCGMWWLRSPCGDYSRYAKIVYVGGNFFFPYVNDTHLGVVPALQIKI